jgi:hypothetical protein
MYQTLQSLDRGELKMWERMKAPPIAIAYWRLPVSPSVTFRLSTKILSSFSDVCVTYSTRVAY